MNKQRLLLLADFLATKVPEDRWDYETIVGDDWKGEQDLSCGTTACALGWAATIPELRAAGMKLVIDQQFNDGEIWVDGEAVFKIARKVFDINELDVYYLFSPESGHNPLYRKSSAKAVAQHIRTFVSHGREE